MDKSSAHRLAAAAGPWGSTKLCISQNTERVSQAIKLYQITVKLLSLIRHPVAYWGCLPWVAPFVAVQLCRLALKSEQAACT